MRSTKPNDPLPPEAEFHPVGLLDLLCRRWSKDTHCAGATPKETAMQLVVSSGKVLIDAEREQALRDFAHGMPLPEPARRDIATMLEWIDIAISILDRDNELDAARYAALVLDKQYLRLAARGLMPTRN